MGVNEMFYLYLCDIKLYFNTNGTFFKFKNRKLVLNKKLKFFFNIQIFVACFFLLAKKSRNEKFDKFIFQNI